MSLLDRGVVFGFAHVRGGGELGPRWHEAARRDRKRITYTDLIAVAEGLVKRGLAARDGIVLEGISAGGGTVLATAALRPDLFRAVLAEVPLADVLDTELDFTRPFALNETAEYGDPRLPHEYRYLRAYDPYYSLGHDRPLPPTYVDAALNDAGWLVHWSSTVMKCTLPGTLQGDETGTWLDGKELLMRIKTQRRGQSASKSTDEAGISLQQLRSGIIRSYAGAADLPDGQEEL
ncbi:prolyl oligopeptidase family serine peptidase [Phyllobacterium zundukense]|uniref:Prolyl oligopeptidase family serine peptidase n=1 Tax=Phyllobacterium zundukense TaxID=1867719 RepID=A0ACD4CVP1_9HYPH|nr:prolyl oligopeptidase family serine peptidase [Phyllobacterium zundukense]UXN57631.1 prolyl oligopeptidase family serine peptidase [Phyllobacterium zundukense]